MRSEALRRAQRKYYFFHKEYFNKSPLSEKAREELKINRKQIEDKNKERWNVILKELGMYSCQLCGFDEHFSAIEFHHIDSSTKKKQFNNCYRLSPTSERIREVKKCVALCANCHRLLHNNVFTIYRDEDGWHRK
jgi:predicted HNH restriction endonuclease